jgi:hypothetical protein
MSDKTRVLLQGITVRRESDGQDEGPDFYAPHRQPVAFELSDAYEGQRFVRVELVGMGTAYLPLADLVEIAGGLERLARVVLPPTPRAPRLPPRRFWPMGKGRDPWM